VTTASKHLISKGNCSIPLWNALAIQPTKLGTYVETPSNYWPRISAVGSNPVAVTEGSELVAPIQQESTGSMTAKFSLNETEAVKLWKLLGHDKLKEGRTVELLFVKPGRSGARTCHVTTQEQYLCVVRERGQNRLCAVSLHPRVGQGTTGKDVSEVGTLFLDIEPDNPKGAIATREQKDTCVAFARNSLVEWFEKRGFAIPEIADSGNGVHVFSPIPSVSISDEPRYPDKVRAFTALLRKDLQPQLAGAGLKVDSVHDLPRRVKITGTKKPIEGAHESRFLSDGVRHEDAKLRDYIIGLVPYVPEKKSAILKSLPSGALDAKNIPLRFEHLLRDHPRLKAAYEGTLGDLADNTRSGHDLSLVSQLIRLGVVNETALAAIVYSTPHRKAAEHDRPGDYIARTLMTAMASALPGLVPGTGMEGVAGAPEYLSLAQDFRDGRAYFAIEVLENRDLTDKEGKPFRKKVRTTKLVTSDRCFIPLPESPPPGVIEVPGTNFQTNSIPRDLGQGWRIKHERYSVEAFVRGTAPNVDPRTLFTVLRHAFESYVYVPDRGDSLLATLFLMNSYVYRLFRSTPYLLLNGPKGSGKTTAGHLFYVLGFNAEMTTHCTAASLFRTLDRMRGLVVMDETENMQTRRGSAEDPRSELLKGGYRAGAAVSRVDTNDYSRTLYFDLYSPKVIANIYGLDDVLSDRAIPIQTRVAPKREAAALSQQPLVRQSEKWCRYRDMLYCLALQNHEELARIRDEMNLEGIGFHGRDLDLWFPLFVMAQFLETTGLRGVVSELQKLAARKKSVRATHRHGPEDAIRVVLLDLLEGKTGPQEISMDALELAVNDDAGETVSRREIGQWLKTLGVPGAQRRREKDDDGKTRMVRFYPIDPALLRRSM